MDCAESTPGEFVCLLRVDIDWPTSESAAWQGIRTWADEAGASNGVRIVISNRTNWRNPSLDMANAMG